MCLFLCIIVEQAVKGHMQIVYNDDLLITGDGWRFLEVKEKSDPLETGCVI